MPLTVCHVSVVIITLQEMVVKHYELPVSLTILLIIKIDFYTAITITFLETGVAPYVCNIKSGAS